VHGARHGIDALDEHLDSLRNAAAGNEWRSAAQQEKDSSMHRSQWLSPETMCAETD
jgi:hypothetical protein